MKLYSKILIIVLIASFLMVIINTFFRIDYGPMPNPSTYKFLYWSIQHISTSDGVSGYEAQIISQAYYNATINGCGYTKFPSLVDHHYVCPVVGGMASESSGNILVNKRSGDLTFNGNVISFNSLKNQTRSLLKKTK